jgi:hypothetical protein
MEDSAADHYHDFNSHIKFTDTRPVGYPCQTQSHLTGKALKSVSMKYGVESTLLHLPQYLPAIATDLNTWHWFCPNLITCTLDCTIMSLLEEIVAFPTSPHTHIRDASEIRSMCSTTKL